MIRSKKLEEFFKAYEPEWLHDFLVVVFGCVYVKSRNSPDLGLCCWYGVKPKDWDDPWPHSWTEIWAEVNSALPSLAIFINYTEDEVIHKFTKYQKLKAFL